PGIAPIDLALVDLLIKQVARPIEIDRPGLAVHRFLEGEIDLLRDAFDVVDAVGVFDASPHDRHLVDFLEHLPAELADRAGAAKPDHRAAIYEGVGETGRQIDRRRAGGRHADARALGNAAIGLRGEGRRLLVADVNEADALLD